MKYIDVPIRDTRPQYLEFLESLGFRTQSNKANLTRFLARRRWKFEIWQDKNLIYFVIINKKTNQVKYYSKPILKYIPERDKEIRFMVRIDGPVKLICLAESDIPLYNYNQLRIGKIPPKEKRD